MGMLSRNRRGGVLICCLLWLLLATAGEGLATEDKAEAKGVQLFGTMEFKTSLKALPQWNRVLSVADDQARLLSQCSGADCPPAARGWQKALRQSKGQPPLSQLKVVNSYFNQWPYRLDLERFGVNDYWAAPEEFLTLSGDCEDYSIVKYFALKQLGFDSRDMRIVVVKDRIRNVGHAVLAVYLDHTAYILDNLSNLVLPHETYSHYLPQYSVNEAQGWAHIGAVGKTKGN
jgi:predicted transglutaminase-like cysteine proteinase